MLILPKRYSRAKRKRIRAKRLRTDRVTKIGAKAIGKCIAEEIKAFIESPSILRSMFRDDF